MNKYIPGSQSRLLFSVSPCLQWALTRPIHVFTLWASDVHTSINQSAHTYQVSVQYLLRFSMRCNNLLWEKREANRRIIQSQNNDER